MAELEKLGQKYRVALRYLFAFKISKGCIRFFLINWCKFGRIAKDPRFERLPCVHKGTYADDCLVDRVTQVTASCFVLLNFVSQILSGELMMNSCINSSWCVEDFIFCLFS